MDNSSPYYNMMEELPGESGLVFPPSNTETYTATPTSVISRKRRFVDDMVPISKHKNFQSFSTSPWTYDDTHSNTPKFLSSTMNESLTNTLERCTLDSFNSNFYIERTDLSEDKKSPSDTAMEFPTTPVKSNINPNFRNMKTTSSSPMQKLGSPERNKILYPNLYPTSSFRYSDYNKRNSPAKKRLFPNLRKQNDPIGFFWNKRKRYHNIVSKILLSLDDRDLYACYAVCKNWRDAITVDDNSKNRICNYVSNQIMNKENYCLTSSESSPESCSYSEIPFKSTPISNLKSQKSIYEITNLMSDDQSLEKCLHCGKSSSIVDKNISQCTRFNCGYIRCLNCNSFSVKGPENFIDNCKLSDLLVEKPRSKYSLMVSPKRGYSDSGLPSFFADTSMNISTPINSSGYMTESDRSSSMRRNSISFGKEKSRIFQASNTDFSNTRKSSDNRYSFVPVIPVESDLKKAKVIEPETPPKINYGACSKKSKKMLKRLLY